MKKTYCIPQTKSIEVEYTLALCDKSEINVGGETGKKPIITAKDDIFDENFGW